MRVQSQRIDCRHRSAASTPTGLQHAGREIPEPGSGVSACLRDFAGKAALFLDGGLGKPRQGEIGNRREKQGEYRCHSESAHDHPAKCRAGFGSGTGWQADRHPRMTGDVTGDGKDDVVGFFDDGVHVSPL